MSQALAVVGQITAIKPIDGADRIMHATAVCGRAGTWSGVVGLGHHIGERVIVFLQDAVLPPDPRWDFMAKHKYRVRMARFKGVASECVIVPAVDPSDDMKFDMPVGSDLSKMLGVTKYSKPLPVSMAGEAIGPFPSFIPKTDEPNFQTVPELVERIRTDAIVVTLKCDGTSCTAWNDDEGNLHVASRNWELREFNGNGAGNSYWRVARLYDMSQLPAGHAIQFEVVGPGIQGNPMGLKDIEGRAFTLYDYARQARCSYSMLCAVSNAIGIPKADLIDYHPHGEMVSSDELRKLAEVKYANGKIGEGVVIRARDGAWSFKCINLLYKD